MRTLRNLRGSPGSNHGLKSHPFAKSVRQDDREMQKTCSSVSVEIVGSAALEQPSQMRLSEQNALGYESS
jgi:hypothetical protein